MARSSAIFLIFLSATTLACLGAELDFNRDIRPILSNNCIFCHGPDEEERKAGLRLDTREGILQDNVVIPGDTDNSLLIKRIDSNDPDEQMPPPESAKALTAEERALLHQWIAEGAAWEDHWAYVAPKPVPVPEVKRKDWPLGAVDHFILARLEEEALPPVAEADRATLLRRLSFDLTGLPPSVELLDRFLQDSRPDAYEQVVDELLGSEHFGERMAMYWLDLVRYADTVGYHGDQDHQISPYRDWVIDAFNENMPFDAFTKAQLAGDLLPEATVDDKIASGYNRLLQTSHEGGVQPKEYLAIYAADRVRNVSAVWMGGTLGCAQCHDHKYDPYTLQDFYTMAAFFADIDEEQHFKDGTNDLPTRRAPEIDVLSRRDREALARVEKALEDGAIAPDKRARLAQRRDAILANKRRTMITVAKKTPRVTRVLPRGNWLDDSGEIVAPAVPAFMGTVGVKGRRPTRLDLAHWLTDGSRDSGKQTARVFANRFWYLLFGRGLSASLEDFGGQGSVPDHPELLDYLALAFVDDDWDVKAFLKDLVMSRTYRLSSQATPALLEKDPDNRLFGRQARHRMPAEMIRDAALDMAGLLDKHIGGASVKPYQPEGYYRHLNFPQRRYHHHEDARQWRRGLYVHWQRQFLHPMLRAFDAPSREECSAERPRSNTPTAALTLLNDPTFVEAARALAERLLRGDRQEFEARLAQGFRLALSRGPTTVEEDLLRTLYQHEQEHYQKHPQDARALIQTGQAAVADDLDPVEWAAWTAVARALLNLDETITRH